MSLNDYRLLAQLGAGSDGVSYRAETRKNGSAAEVRILSRAPADAERFSGLCKRLRLAAMLDHAGAVQIREFGLQDDPPLLVVEWVEGKSLAEELQGALPLLQTEAIQLGQALVRVVAAAHRLGLAHNNLAPNRILRSNDSTLKIDFTNTRTITEDSAFREMALSCRPHDYRPDDVANLPVDIYALGAILSWLHTGKPLSTEPNRGDDRSAQQQVTAQTQAESSVAPTLLALIRTMLAADPSDRPLISDVESQLAAFLGKPAVTAASDENATVLSDVGSKTSASFDDTLGRDCLGRFRLLNKLGSGGMGAVYLAEDVLDGSHVAIKVLRPDWAKRPTALRRFNKEARLLAEVNNPYVANLLEVNEDGGIHYLVLEYVEGKNLGKLLDEQGRLSESMALAIIGDVARALMEAHERGIVHRDVKPDNILLVSGEVVSDGSGRSAEPNKATLASTQYSPKVKLTDFGLARHVVESESLNMTQAGAILGTPYYMAPEQCKGADAIGPPTDVYAMGATLFHLLAGRPPFMGDNQFSVISMHCNEAPPALKKINEAVSDAVCQIIEKCLAKAPEARYANAGALLRDLERVTRGEPTSITVHPRLPDCDPAKVIHYDWTWELEASPQQLWSHVSNTERLNRACDLPAIQFSAEADATGVRRYGKIRKMGLNVAWQEHPFEWIEARRFGVLREFSQGPLKWVMSVVELTPRAGGGTTLTHRVRVEPKGLIGRTAAALEIGTKGRRAVDRVYHRIDAALTHKLGDPGLADPFEEPAGLPAAKRRRLDPLLEKLNECGVNPSVVERLGDFLALAPAQEVARIRPFALARRLALDPEQVVAACLHGAREGLLVLLWDILCPVCRIPSEVKDTLKVLRKHGRCEACKLDFELDFANSVEMIFRAHPAIRDTELGVYCIGGPAHSPHVVAQVRVGPAERIELDLPLPEGAYRLRGPQLSFVLDFCVQPGAPGKHWELNLSRGPEPELPRTLRAGRQMIALCNDQVHEVVARIERAAPRDDALTAARASTLALFRELFPGEILSPGQLVSVANVTLLVTELEGAGNLYQEMGDAGAFGVIHEHFRFLDDCVRREGGALVKTIGDGILASFAEPVAAVRAALEMRKLAGTPATMKNFSLRVGIHSGPALAATLNDHLDYFGATVNFATSLLRNAGHGDILLTLPVTADPAVVALVQERKLEMELIASELASHAGAILQRVVLGRRPGTG